MDTSEVLIQSSLALVYDVSLSQKELITTMAHELRTPIAIIRADTEVALMSPHVSRELRLTLMRTLVEVDRISASITALVESVRAREKSLPLGSRTV